MKKNLFDIRDRVIVITGGMGLLGRQFTRSLCDAGAKVAVVDIRIEPKEFENYFGDYIRSDRVTGIVADITHRESLEIALHQINEKWGIPFGLINNAGLILHPMRPLRERAL